MKFSAFLATAATLSLTLALEPHADPAAHRGLAKHRRRSFPGGGGGGPIVAPLAEPVGAGAVASTGDGGPVAIIGGGGGGGEMGGGMESGKGGGKSGSGKGGGGKGKDGTGKGQEAQTSGLASAEVPPPPAAIASGSAVTPPMAAMGSGGQTMDQCVQQCMAGGTFLPPGSTAANTSAIATAVNGSLVANGPNNVVVAPKMGDLRMVPFAISAAPGSMISWEWGAGPHTVTQSSALEVCNKTGTQTAFISGMRNATATFAVPVNSSDTIWYYCQVKDHCVKGMFGLINPPMAGQMNNSMQSAIDGMAAQNATMAQMVGDTKKMTAKNDRAGKWGGMMDVSKFPQDKELMWASMKNTLLTRQFFAANPTLLDAPSDAGMMGGMSMGAGASMSMTASASVPGAAAVPTGSGGANPVAAAAAAPGTTPSSGAGKRIREHEGAVLGVLGVMAFLALV